MQLFLPVLLMRTLSCQRSRTEKASLQGHPRDKQMGPARAMSKYQLPNAMLFNFDQGLQALSGRVNRSRLRQTDNWCRAQ